MATYGDWSPVSLVALRNYAQSEIGAAMLSSETAIEGLKPAGLLQGRDPVGGGSPESAEADVYATVAAVRGGVRVFPDLGLNGGFIAGVPVVIVAGAESKLVFVGAAMILVADGGVDVDRADSASRELSDSPSGGSVQQVSLWQTGSIAVRTRRWINWMKAFDDSIAYCDVVGAGSPA